MRYLSWALSCAGGGLLLFALAADWLRIGEPGFGERQAAALTLGLLALIMGIFLGRRADAARPRPTIATIWRAAAVMVANTATAFLILNLLAAGGLKLAGPSTPDDGIRPLLERMPLMRAVSGLAERWSFSRLPQLRLPREQLSRIYPGWRREDLARLLRETRDRRLTFDPYTQTREATFHGTYVNVEPAGFRAGAKAAPWPPDPAARNVWVLGGSTTFGYGVPDGETIPSQLEAVLASWHPGAPVHVYNFGQGYFYSTPELALFDSLLAAGVPPPAQAVFIDGINEHFAAPFYSDWLADLLRSPLRGWLSRPAARSLPSGDRVVSRWLRTRRLAEGVCRAYAIACLFVWQPAPDWDYDIRYHLLWEPRPSSTSARVTGDSPHYSAMATRVASSRLGPGFLWLGDMQHDRREPLYVDRLHYTAAFSRDIAERIADALDEP